MMAYAAMALEAARQSGLAANAVESLLLKQPLEIPESDAMRVQIILDGNNCEILSAGTGNWISHAAACLVQRQISQSAEPLDELQRRIAVPVDRASIYTGLQRRGIRHGAMLMALEEVWAHDKEALGCIRIPASVPNVKEYLAHPVLLDAAAQLLAAALEPDEHAFIPLTTERIIVTQPLGAEVWAHARLRQTSSIAALIADIVMFDRSGQRVAEISGLELKRVDRTDLARVLHAHTTPDWVYEFCWQMDSSQARIAHGNRPAVLARNLEVVASAYGRECGLPRYEDFLPLLDNEIVAAIVHALHELGFVFVPGRRLTVVELAEELQIAPSHRRWFGRLLDILTAASILHVCDGGLEVPAEPGRRLGEFAVLRQQFPEFSPELNLTARCTPQFAEVLRGNCAPLHVLFPEGSFQAAEELYLRSVSARAYNRLVAEAVSEILRAAGPGSCYRILEIGGGTGGTTDAIAQALPQGIAEYVFTDVSPLLVARARERFGGHDAFRFQTFDIEREPASQGLGQSFDIIIAANVLHATADLRSTLARVRKLMAPGGILLMLEVTEPCLWIDATFGMTDGWWKFTDRDLRPNYPTLCETQWQELLADLGLESRAISAGAGSMQALIVAGCDRVTTAEGQWLIVADGGGVADHVAHGLEQQGASCTLVRPDAALTCALEQNRSWRGIVLLSGLDAGEGSEAAPLDWQEPLCGSLLRIVQHLTREGVGKPPELFIVTREAQAVQAEDRVRGFAQAPLWGFARTIALEHPELSCKCIDIDTADDSRAAITEELLRRDSAAQVALRDGRRYVPRLERWSSEDAQSRPQALVSHMPGSLDALAFETMHRRPPGRGEIEIQVELTALNFRDVLSALGTYAGDPGPLGSECGGRIVSIGPGVSGFEVGQQVVAASRGAARSIVSADARLACPVPHGMTLEEAVTLPMAFLTAAYALEKLGGIRAGERVLIHAAAGGVGLAAVQIAQNAGAEVFATAGTEWKRVYLRSLGIRHVFDSRSTEFSRAVIEATGGEGADLVLNSLAGELIGASFAALRQGGRFVELGRNAIWDAARVRALGKGIEYFVIDGDALMSTGIETLGVLFRDLMNRAAAGYIKPLPYRVFPFQSSRVAFRFMAQARHTGKLLLRHPTSQLAMDPAGAYVLTGGLGALGLHAAEWLASSGAKNVALLGRHEPSEAARKSIAALDRAGVRVLVCKVDVASVSDLAVCLAEIRATMGPIRGVIHAAGSLSDGVLAQQTWARFAQVLPAKVGGAWNLHSLTESDPLQFFVLFSSIAGPLGSPGQANHAAASDFLDALAAYRRNRGLCALSIDWGPWAGGGSADRVELTKQRREIGISDIPVQQAIGLLAHGIAADAGRLLALPVAWKKLAARRPACALLVQHLIEEVKNTPATPTQPVEESWIEKWRAVPATRRGPMLEQQLQRLAARILGLEAGTRVDPAQALNELGLDSLMAVELRNAISQVVEQPLVATLLFSYPTIESLVKYLLDLVFGSNTPPEAVSEPSSQSAVIDVLAQIERLSDEEVEQLYSERTGGPR
jgi:NADPH:quinone reductase-like Zn-dependent oxidoreductase/SAM-dependent methyltransferase/acyl carrier protein